MPVRRESGLSDLFLLLSVVLLVASGALAGGVFLYGQYLAQTNASKVDQLDRAKAAFEPTLISQLTRLDDRMHVADALLASHVAPGAFFDALSAATLSTVSFSDLNFTASDQHHLTIRMSGIARSVNSIALQAELFSKNGIITNPIFSGISRQPDGVHFNLTADVNASAIGYSRVMAAQANAAASQAAAAAATTQEGSAAPQTPASPFGGPQQGASTQQ